MNYIDLFHGIGGFSLGAYWAGMKFKNHFCSDIEPYCQKLFKLRFPDSIQLGDIKKIDFEKLKNDYKGNWIITGGFPCQDISIAGKGKGIIKNETRSGLWYEMFRAIRILRPKFTVIENVSAITFRGLNILLSSLAEIGYDAEWQDIRASDMGAPHRRERIWIISYPNSAGNRQPRQREEAKTQKRLQQRSKQTRELQSGFKGLCSEISYPKQQHDDNSGHGASQIQRKRSETTEIQGCFSDSNSQGLEKRKKCESRKTFTTTIKQNWWTIEPAVGRLVNGVPGRVDRLKGLGNSIVPQIAELLFNLLKPYLKEEDK